MIVRVGNGAGKRILASLIKEYKMARGKSVREKGKLRLSEYFKKIDDNQRVAVVFDKGVSTYVPSRFQGRSGVVVGNRGNFKVVELNDGNKKKTFMIHPVHLKKL